MDCPQLQQPAVVAVLLTSGLGQLQTLQQDRDNFWPVSLYQHTCNCVPVLTSASLW